MKTPADAVRLLALLVAVVAGSPVLATDAPDVCAKGGLGIGRGWIAMPGEGGALPPPDPVGGVGGTGVSGLASGTGSVFGTVTRFGSICVNGVEIAIAAGTTIQEQTRSRPDSDAPPAIGMGQVVRVEVARGEGREVVAQRVWLLDRLSGPVTARDAGAHRFAVMGRSVRLGRDSMVSLSGPSIPEVGAVVSVSGFVGPDGDVIATRLAPAPARAGALVTGVVRDVDGSLVDVDGVTVDLGSGGGDTAAALLQREVTIEGQWQEDRIAATRLVLEPAMAFDRLPDWVSIEGYLMRCDSGEYGLDGLPLRVRPDAGLDAWVGHRVVLLGRMGNDGAIDVRGMRRGSLDEDTPAATGREVRAAAQCGRRPVLPRDRAN